MEGDPFVARLVELDQGCLELTERLERLRVAVVEIRRMRKQGRPSQRSFRPDRESP